MGNLPPGWQNLMGTVAVVQRATAPPVNTIIADSGALPAGVYKVVVSGSYGGVADVIDNFSLFRGDKFMCTLPATPVANGSPIPVELPAVIVAEGTHLTIQNPSAGGAGAVFRGVLVITPVTSLDIT